MTLNDLEDKLKGLAPSIEVPKELAERLISAVSEHALKKQRRRLIWQYLGHGFTSVIVGFFAIKWIAPGLDNKNLAIAGAIILAMFWLLFKVSSVTHRQNFGRIALSAATFGFVVATTGLFTLGGPQSSDTIQIESTLPGLPEVIEQASDSETKNLPTITPPMEEEKSVNDFQGTGYFGELVSKNEIDGYMNITSLLDTGEKITIPVPIELYEMSALQELEMGDRIYIENQSIFPVDKKPFKNQKNKNQSQTPFMES